MGSKTLTNYRDAIRANLMTKAAGIGAAQRIQEFFDGRRQQREQAPTPPTTAS